MSAASDEFVREMLDGHSFPSGQWQNFDPPFKRATVTAFERRGWVETRGQGREAEHRWTALGQAELLADHLRFLGYTVGRSARVAEKLRSVPAIQARASA